MPSEKTRGCLWACSGCAAAAVFALVLGVVAVRVSFKSYRESGASMAPTLTKGDVVMTRPAREIERGDLIAFRSPVDRSIHLKRVIGLPGDVVEIRNSGAVVNGTELDEPHIMREPEVQAIRDMPPVTVPPDSYFVLGDNRDNSNDSRYYGPVKREDIVGKAVFVLSEKNGAWRP